jgi:predicted PurR-regulated permease PerM
MLSPSRIIRQRVAIASIVAVGVSVLALIAPYVGGLLLALVLHVLVAPAYQRIARLVSPGVASAIVIIGIVVLLVAPSVWLISLVVAQLPGAVESVQDTGLLLSLSTLRIGPIDIGARIGGFGGTAAGWVAARATALLGGAASTMLDLIISLFAVYYLLRSGDATWRAVRPFIPFSEEHANELLAQFHSATRSTLLGSVLIAVMQGGLVGTSFWLAGLSSAPFWGVVATIASLIPLFGSAIVWVPGVIALAMQARYGAAVIMLAFCGVVVSSVDNFVRPIVSQRISAVHPMITLIGAFAGIRVFGLLGLVLGPLSISYFFVLLRMYREEYSPIAFDALGTTGERKGG